MYSSKENVNQLTSLLVQHGIRHAVVCPGSRNAPIVHNLNECPGIQCHPVTDERSAGFYALGMCQALNEPVAVCVTSGSALLNLAPAVAEAWYQHMPLIVISADRPPQWIDQLDGQTLPQPDALGRFVRKAVTLPEPRHEEERWLCNRLLNEALLDAVEGQPAPVHINVPITEPLFVFDTPELPQERIISRRHVGQDYGQIPEELIEAVTSAERPMIVFGQTNPHDFEGIGVEFLFSHVIVLHESLSRFPCVSHFDEALYCCEPELPDLILYVGDTIVSKRLRHFLRRATQAKTWRIGPSPRVEDTFMNLGGILVGDAEFILQSLSGKLTFRHLKGTAYRRQWLHALTSAAHHALSYQPVFSQMLAVKLFEEHLHEGIVHYANSTAVRLANIYASHHVWCNRGVNGIEGSLSTAAGFSCITDERVYCVIGDLSFFYDQNALWNQHLRGNFRILLLNNGRGGIFNQLRGLEQSPARDAFVSASHHTTAEGICRQNHLLYLKAEDAAELRAGIDTLFNIDSSRPVLLEVFTDAAEDARVFKDYYRAYSKSCTVDPV